MVRVMGVDAGGRRRRGGVVVAVHVHEVRKVREAVVGGHVGRHVVRRSGAAVAVAAVTVAVLVRGGGERETVILVHGGVGVARGRRGGRWGRRVVAVIACR